jgi:hypothetical protein
MFSTGHGKGYKHIVVFGYWLCTMVTDFMFYNLTRGNQEGEWPEDYCAIRNTERYGTENAKRGFELVIERNKWSGHDNLVAIGDSWQDIRSGWRRTLARLMVGVVGGL